jgi:hypothetical protein
MARQVPRRNQDRVKTQLEFGLFGMRGELGLCGIDDPPPASVASPQRPPRQAAAGLDLDEGQKISPFGDDIDLANPLGEPVLSACSGAAPSVLTHPS